MKALLVDFLVKNGFAHKIEQLNSFVGCVHPGKDHSPAFMICTNCNFVSEEEGIKATRDLLIKIGQTI